MHRKSLTGVMVLMAFALLMGGCEAALFPRETGRTPYDRYLTLRGRQPVQQDRNTFGTTREELRSRLKPLGQP